MTLEQVGSATALIAVAGLALACIVTAIFDHFADDPRKKLAEIVAKLWRGARIALATAVCTSVAAILVLICIACPLLLIVIPIPALYLIAFIACRIVGEAA